MTLTNSVKMADYLPGSLLEDLTGLKRATFRDWASDGLLHPTQRVWNGKPTNYYNLKELRRVLSVKSLTSEKCMLALQELEKYLGWKEEQVIAYLSRQKYTTSVNFDLVGGVAHLARRLLPAPARVRVPAGPPVGAAPARPLAAVDPPARPPATAAPARPPVMGPRAMKRSQEELGCQKAVVSLLWVTGFAVLALVMAIAKVKGMW